MKPSAHSAEWCSQWDQASEELLRLLDAHAPDGEAVKAALTKRQRLTTAQPPPTPGRTREEQRAWLEVAVATESRIHRAFEAYQEKVVQARASFAAGQKTRKAFELEAEPARRRLDKTV